MAIDLKRAKAGGGINPLGLIMGAFTGGLGGAAAGAVSGGDSPIGRAMAMKSKLAGLGGIGGSPEAEAVDPVSPISSTPEPKFGLGVDTNLGGQLGAMRKRLGY
jgi:hypothetical protein